MAGPPPPPAAWRSSCFESRGELRLPLILVGGHAMWRPSQAVRAGEANMVAARKTVIAREEAANPRLCRGGAVPRSRRVMSSRASIGPRKRAVSDAVLLMARRNASRHRRPLDRKGLREVRAATNPEQRLKAPADVAASARMPPA